MKRIILRVMCLCAAGLVSSARADEFGPRFQEEAPMALADITYDLQDIAPAAGDTETVIDGAYPVMERTEENPEQYRGYNFDFPVREQ